MSIAPDQTQSFANNTSSEPDPLDSFQTPLTLDTQVPVREGSRTRQVAIRNLLEEAGRGRTWALDALDSFLAERLTAYESNNQMCYLSCEDNIGPILTQLRSHDPIERREAAKSLLGIILGEAPDAVGTSNDLRRGLLVAARKISEINQDRTFYEEMAQLDPASRQRIRQLVQQGQIPSDPQLMQATRVQGDNPSQPNRGSQSPASQLAQGGGGIGPSAPLPAGPQATAVAYGAPTPVSSSGLEGLIENTLTKALADHGLQDSFLSGSTRSTVTARLQEILQTPGLSTAQISQTLYYAILGRTWTHPDFSSVENHYAEFRPAARQVAGDLLQRLGLTVGSRAGTDTSAPTLVQGEGSPTLASRSDAAGHPATGRSLSTAKTGLTGWLGTGSEVAVAAPGTGIPTTSSVAAGMMGVNFFALAGRPIWQSTGFGGGDRPDYFVEGATPTDGESHHGSQSQSDGDQDQGHQDSSGAGENIFVA